MNYYQAIPAAIRVIRGSDVFDVGWRAASSRYRDAARVDLAIVAFPRLGVQAKRWRDNGDGTSTEVITFDRRLVVQCICYTDSQVGDENAHELAADLTAGFHRSDVLEVLAAANLGAPQTQNPIDVSGPDDRGDWTSAVAFEIWFPTTRTQDGATIATVAEAVTTGTVTGEAGGSITVGPIDVLS